MKTQWLWHSFGCPDQYRSVVPGPVPVIWPLPTFDSPPSPPNLARPRRCLSPNGRKFARPVQWNSDKQIWPFGPPPPTFILAVPNIYLWTRPELKCRNCVPTLTDVDPFPNLDHARLWLTLMIKRQPVSLFLCRCWRWFWFFASRILFESSSKAYCDLMTMSSTEHHLGISSYVLPIR